MNYKLVFPTYRNRWQFVKGVLHKYRPVDGFRRVLHIGCGEGDYDPILAQHSAEVQSCDINADDVAFARALNADLTHVHYAVQDALKLPYADQTFDLVFCLEVIEHVGAPQKLMAEIARLVTPGGLVVMTFPQQGFPITYDPINLLLSIFGRRRYIPLGAYGYGHDYLIDVRQYKAWAATRKLTLIEERPLTSYLASVVELYWPSLLQKFLKPNAGNHTTAGEARRVGLRPSRREPWLAYATDALNTTDSLLFSWTGHSVNTGMVLRKEEDAG
jgi:SAM-dependent methyltransferase